MILVSDVDNDELSQLVNRYRLNIIWVSAGEPIPGSFWGEPEAGLLKNVLYLRNDTPMQSALHEACHYICMDNNRRLTLDTTSGGDYDEENAVCYLQILLSDYISNCTQVKMMQDMDAWGYSFRLGSAQQWFENDAEDARQWLIQHNIIDSSNQITWKLRK